MEDENYRARIIQDDGIAPSLVLKIESAPYDSWVNIFDSVAIKREDYEAIRTSDPNNGVFDYSPDAFLDLLRRMLPRAEANAKVMAEIFNPRVPNKDSPGKKRDL